MGAQSSGVSGRRRVRYVGAALVCALVAMFTATTASAGTVVRPDGLGLGWGPAGTMASRVPVPGPPIITPPSSYFPAFGSVNGETGYSVYICRAARRAGYTSGPLNQAFDFNTTVNNTVPFDGSGPQLTGDAPNLQHSSVADLARQFNASDSCDNWHSGSEGGLLLRRLPGQSFMFTDPGPPDNPGINIRYDLNVSNSLSIAHADVDMQVASYKTKGNAADGDVRVVIMGSGLNIGKRQAAPSTGLPMWANPRVTQESPARMCEGYGKWDVPPVSGVGAYPASQGWLDGDRGRTEDDGDFGERSFTDTGRVQGNPFYRAGPTSASTPWYPYMTGTGTHTNPNAICRIAGGPSGMFFRQAFRPQAFHLTMGCGSTRGYQGCRGDIGESPETPAAAANSGHNFTYLRSMRIFVRDPNPPSVTLLPGPGSMNAGGATIGSGNTNQTAETVRWDMADDSGIRMIQVSIDGRLMQTWNYNSRCDHRFPAPCPEATGADYGPGGPALARSFDMDVDPLVRGPHTVSVRVQDGSGRWTTADGSFRIDTARREEVCNAGGTTEIGVTGSTEVGRTGVYGADRVTAQPETCNGRDFTDAVPGAPTESVLTPGTTVALPVRGDGVFSYALAVNSAPTASPLDPGNCQIRDQVISGAGAGGGPLSLRERNQIVSVTIDLRSFIKQRGAPTDRGGQLGEHVLRSTFDMPTRATQRYRTALGCPG